MKPLQTLWQFARPHTIVGTTLSVLGLYLIAYAGRSGQSHLPLDLLTAWFSCIAANIYIVGLNQLTDIDIDRINKPKLPLAAGALSVRAGRIIVLVCLGVALLLAFTGGRWLAATVTSSLFIGTIYSLPPLRLKRFYFWAAACIFTVRGVIVNLFLFLHFQRCFDGGGGIPPHVWLLTAFVFGLSLVIAWFKDIPDSEGDGRYSISTLTLRLGPRRVFRLGMSLLSGCYLGVAVAGLVGLPGVNRLVLIVPHLLLLALAWQISRRVDPSDKATITRYYLFVWLLFFAEYLIFPLACLADQL